MLGKENYVKYVLRNKCHMSPWSLGRIQAKELLRTEDSETVRNKTKQKNGAFSAAISKRLTSTFQITQYNASETNEVAIFDDTMEKLEILLL